MQNNWDMDLIRTRLHLATVNSLLDQLDAALTPHPHRYSMGHHPQASQPAIHRGSGNSASQLQAQIIVAGGRQGSTPERWPGPE